MRKRTSKPSRELSQNEHGCRPGLSRQAKTMEELVAEYQEYQKFSEKGWNPLRSLLEGYRGLANLETAVESAALAEDLVGKSYGKKSAHKIKRHAHQRRIKPAVLDNAKRVLASKSNIQKLKSCRSFEEIFELVTQCCEPITGLGPLYIYDTALRIAAFAKKRPRHVHLHAGALAGARALGLLAKDSSLPKSAFPRPIQRLNPQEIEDFLCIYKSRLSVAKSNF